MSLGDKFRAGKARRQARQLAKAQAKSDAGRNLTRRQQAMLDNAARWENPTQPTQPTSRTSYTPTFETYNRMDQLDKEAGVSDTKLSNAPVEADTEDVTVSPKPKGRWVKQPDGTSKMVFDTGSTPSKPSDKPDSFERDRTQKTDVKGVDSGGYTYKKTVAELKQENRDAKVNKFGLKPRWKKGADGEWKQTYVAGSKDWNEEKTVKSMRKAWAKKYGSDSVFPMDDGRTIEDAMRGLA